MNVLHSAPGFESLLIVKRGEILMRADGLGDQAEPMIEATRHWWRIWLKRAALDSPSLTRNQIIAQAPDLVVIRNGRVVALLIPTVHGGGDLMTVRINPERPTATAAGSTVGREPALSDVTAPPEPTEGGEA